MDFLKEVWLDGNGNPNYGRERPSVVFFIEKNQSLTRCWPVDRRGCFGQERKWDVPLGLDFGLYELYLL
jgi:hypothetical protein